MTLPLGNTGSGPDRTISDQGNRGVDNRPEWIDEQWRVVVVHPERGATYFAKRTRDDAYDEAAWRRSVQSPKLTVLVQRRPPFVSPFWEDAGDFSVPLAADDNQPNTPEEGPA
jgi:hypothetical protein